MNCNNYDHYLNAVLYKGDFESMIMTDEQICEQCYTSLDDALLKDIMWVCSQSYLTQDVPSPSHMIGNRPT